MQAALHRATGWYLDHQTATVRVLSCVPVLCMQTACHPSPCPGPSAAAQALAASQQAQQLL
jgi:hypothetical protein